MRANEVRRAFTAFFEDRGHTRVQSASLIPHDPTLLFTVAGMVPFKPYLIGEEPPPWPRATSVQKCVRAGGKHNDLDEIGRTKRHLTFFEMMGNFSFGDYFKEQAIPYAWEFVTEVLELDPERLWVTVHLSDDEAEAIWRDEVGVPAERIQRLDEDNFWQMADTGPCGPCSEIFWDKGVDYGADGGPAEGGAERFVEIWNLVFMQFEQHEDGTRDPLPKPSIDTGLGLERLVGVLQEVDSVFDTDEFARLIRRASAETGVAYGQAEASDISLRILADHARAMTFLVSDGVVPSNEDRGYVLRRIMRRAVRHAYLLGVEEVVTPALVDEVVAIMGQDYPDLAKSHDAIRATAQREEEGFRRTLATGSAILDTELDRLAEGEPIAGAVAFQLHDTHGFPVELTEEIAAEQGIAVDVAGFEAAMDEQRRRAQAARKAGPAADAADYHEILDRSGPTVFVGREVVEADAAVVGVVEEGDADAPVSVFLDRTPFYAASGGQIGDIGTIETDTGRIEVVDTTHALTDLTRHHGRVVEGSISAGQSARALIDADRRAAIARNHTATHLLHWALREVLGSHVKQQGSHVAPDRLRFDFSHFEPVSAADLARIEDLANAEILANAPVHHEERTKVEAEKMGAIAFFGDKYGDVVRVLEAGPKSIELCGGTHVGATGDIGLVKILTEGSIGSNLRRIEAVSGTAPIERLRQEEATRMEVADLLGVADGDLVTGVQKRLDELKELREEVRELKRAATSGRAGDLIAQAVDGVIVARVDRTGRDELRDLAVALRDDPSVEAVVLGGEPEGGGVALVAAVTPNSGLHAGDLIADAAGLVQGGGGRAPDLAVAGGRDVTKLDDALDLVRVAAQS